MITTLNTCIHFHGQTYSWITYLNFRWLLWWVIWWMLRQWLCWKIWWINSAVPVFIRVLYDCVVQLYLWLFLTNLVTSLSSKFHTTLFKVPYHPLQSTVPPSSKYRTTLFKVPHNLLQSTILPFSKYHTTFFKVPYHWQRRLASTLQTWVYFLHPEHNVISIISAYVDTIGKVSVRVWIPLVK